MGKCLKILFVSIFILLLSFECYAETNESALLNEFLSGAPSEYSKIDNIEDISELVNINSTFSFVFNLFSKYMKNCTGIFIMFLVIILLISFVENLDFKYKDSYKNIISTVATIAVLSISFATLEKNIELISDAVGSMKIFTSSAVPVVITLSISSGESFGAALFSTTISFAAAAFEYMTEKVILPLIVIYMVVGTIGNFSKQFAIGNFGGYIKKFIKWIIATFIGLFTISISLQSFISKASDNIAKKVLKAAVGSFIPIIGSTLSGSVDNIFALCSSTKTTFAILGIVIIAVIFSPVIIGNICYGSAAWLAEFIASFAGVRSMKGALNTVAETFFILAAISSAGVYMVMISFLLICLNIG